MLDSSPLPVSPPQKLKRTASVASLPSPPPSVEHPKKRATAHRFNSDTESGSEDEAEVVHEVTLGGKVMGRKLLFPLEASSTSGTDNLDSTRQRDSKRSDGKEQLDSDVGRLMSAYPVIAPASPPPSRRRTAPVSLPLPRTPSPVDNPGVCSASELPVLDEGNNPFLASSPPKPRRARSPRDFAEPRTLTFVYKGIKTSMPNPNYNLSEAALERSRLPLSHPDYSPLPMHAPKRLFPEAFPTMDDDEEDEDSSGEIDDKDAHPQTFDKKPSLSKLFVDAAGNPLPDSGPQGIRGPTMDAREVGRMAVGPIRGRG